MKKNINVIIKENVDEFMQKRGESADVVLQHFQDTYR